MAREGMFFSTMGALSNKTHVPIKGLIVQGIWSCLLALSGTFDQLTDCLLFASWIFYGLVTSSVFVLRRKMPNAARPYKTFGYPLIPMVFVLVAIALIINTLFTRPVESLFGLLLIAIGLPLYFYFRAQQRKGV
jgi:APA family basic amino acid/polyamine antiporter